MRLGCMTFVSAAETLPQFFTEIKTTLVNTLNNRLVTKTRKVDAKFYDVSISNLAAKWPFAIAFHKTSQEVIR